MRKIAILGAALAIIAGAGFRGTSRAAAQSDEALRLLPDGLGVVTIDM